MGVEEFDSRDRPLVWRMTGGKTRRLLGGADAYAEDSIDSFRDAAISLLDRIPAFDLDTMEKEHARLAQRLEKFGQCHDTPEIWKAQRGALFASLDGSVGADRRSSGCIPALGGGDLAEAGFG